MANRSPIYTPLRVADVADGLLDRVRAEVTLLTTADARQHALVTGYGAPPTFISLTTLVCTTPGVSAGGSVVYRVPPGVTHIHLAVLASGRGACRITSTIMAGTPIDAEGALLRLPLPEVSPSLATVEGAEVVSTASVDDLGTDMARAVIVSTSPVLTWQDVILICELDADAGVAHDYARIWGISVQPIHMAMAAT